MATIQYLNDSRGAVEVHSAACADVAKKLATHRFEDAGTAEVDTTREAWVEYNIDFLDEGGAEAAWDIRFLPCCGLKVDNDRSWK